MDGETSAVAAAGRPGGTSRGPSRGVPEPGAGTAASSRTGSWWSWDMHLSSAGDKDVLRGGPGKEREPCKHAVIGS